jgi:release factor glutamine methyltransferase
MSGVPYASSEDSALLRSAMAGRSGSSALEVGAGNGGGLDVLSHAFSLVVGTDLIRPGMGDWKVRGSNFVLADRATCFRSSVFDLVAFNPPYLPSDVTTDVAVDGGKEGTEVPLGFVEEALRVVAKGGRILMLLQADELPEKVAERIRAGGLRATAVAMKKMFFESLTVFELAEEEPGPAG